jgi:cellulose synthase operon protein C
MLIASIVGGLVVSLLQNATYDVIKAGFKSSVPLADAMQRAAMQATNDFLERYGDQFGTGQDCFLARQTNWNAIIQSLFISSTNLTVESFDPRGYEGVKTATVEALDYFIQRLKVRIKEDHALDHLFTTKDHIKEQTEVKEVVERLYHLLEVREEGKLTRQDLVQVVEASMRSVMATSVLGQEKDVADDFINEQIDAYRDLIDENKPLAAISILENLKAKKWDMLSDRLRFRILTNIAVAKLKIGNDNKAAALELLQAERLAPSDKRALTNSAIAHYLLMNPIAAKKKAEEAIKLFPDDPDVYKALLLALYDDGDCLDPLPLIPSELLSFPELCLQIGDFFRQKDNPIESRKWLHRAYQLCQTNDEIQEAYATSLLDELLRDQSVVSGHQMTPLQRKQMTEARDILANLWLKVKDTDVYRRYIACVINLSNADRLLGNSDSALALIEEALRRDPSQILLQKQLCFSLLSKGRFGDTLEKLKKMSDDAFEEKLLVEAETYIALGKPDDALTTIESFLINRPVANDILYVVANTVKVQALEKVEGTDLALAAAVQLADDNQTVPEYLLLVSELLSSKGENEGAIEWTDKANVVSVTYPTRTMVADSYYDLGQYGKAAAVYKDLLKSFEDSRSLRRLVASYLSGDFRAEALDLVSHLPEEVRRLRFYGRACAELYFRLGNLPMARKLLERCIKEAPEDLELHLNYLTLLARMGKQNIVPNLLQKMPQFKDSPPGDLIKLAHLYARYGMQDEALSVGYDTLRRFGSIAGAHLGYCSLLLHALKDIAVINRVRDEQKVEIDTAFTCITGAGKKFTYLIVSDAKDDASGEITPMHLLAKKVLGLHVGDTFVFTEGPIGTEFAEIIEVKHKYLHALHESMTNFQHRFPGVPGMWMFSIAPLSDGGMDLHMIFDVIARRSDAVLHIEDVYANNPLLLALVARQIGIHPIDCLMGISRAGRVQIKSCIGDFAERNVAYEAVLMAKNGFIMDPFSLYTLYRLQLLDLVNIIAGGKLGITQSTLDLFTELIEERKTMGPFMSLSKDKGQFYRQEVSVEEIHASIQPFEDLLTWCREHCKIIPAVGKTIVDEDSRCLFDGLHSAFLDTLLAASGSEMLLISEDLHYRQVGKLLFNVEGAWCQPLLQVGVDLRHLPEETYHQAVLRLVEMNYTFISISAENLLFHMSKDGCANINDFKKLTNRLRGRSVDLPGAVGVVAMFLCLLRQKIRIDSIVEKATYAILNDLTSDKAISELKVVTVLFVELGRRMVLQGAISERDLQFFNVVLGEWCRGHFLLAGKAKS